MLDLAVESIAYAGRDLHSKLSEMVHFLRVDGTYSTDAIKKTLFSEIVAKHTGLNLYLTVIDYGPSYNAYVALPDMTKGHVFFKMYGSNYLDNTEGNRILGMLENSKKASVDLGAGRVGGLYSEMPMQICLYLNLIRDTTFTDGEIAAVLLHEIGHAFTYFQFINTVAFGGLITSVAAKEIVGAQTKDKRQDVLHLVEKHLGIEATPPHYLDDKELNTKSLQVVLFRNYVAKFQTGTGNVQYDFRNCEQLADQFAAKHGAGRDQVSVLNKMGKLGGDTAYQSSFSYVLVETCKLITYMAGFFFVGPLMLIPLVMSIPVGIKIYDDPEARQRLLRQQVVNSIRDLKLAPGNHDKEIKSLVEDIEFIDALLVEVKDRRTLMQMFWHSIPGFSANLRNQEVAQKELESLLFNDLTYQSARFEMLTK